VLTRVRGIRGEFVALPLSYHQERFENLGKVYLFGSRPEPAAVDVEWVRNAGRSMLIKFHGIDSIEDAEPWKGAEVRVPISERLKLEPGEFYQSDLIGCEVIERATGQSLGTVTGWMEGGSAGLLEVGPDLLIPFARSICVSIDVAARRIEVELPEGLKDLNRP